MAGGPGGGGPDLAMLASMEQASKGGHGASGGGLPSANGTGMQAKVGGAVGEEFSQKSNLDQNFATVGGLNLIPIKPSFDADIISQAFDGNMVPGNMNYSEVFDVNNLAFGDASLGTAVSPAKALNSEAGFSFGKIDSITSR